jgi:hypothetical protein
MIQTIAMDVAVLRCQAGHVFPIAWWNRASARLSGTLSSAIEAIPAAAVKKE